MKLFSTILRFSPSLLPLSKPTHFPLSPTLSTSSSTLHPPICRHPIHSLQPSLAQFPKSRNHSSIIYTAPSLTLLCSPPYRSPCISISLFPLFYISLYLSIPTYLPISIPTYPLIHIPTYIPTYPHTVYTHIPPYAHTHISKHPQHKYSSIK
ncbi:hypothetical protein BDZ91DRAFT_131787 [Kalaharituber pfeilii]|nr:hypothetical protein BDZ91DRAFT_131787 [Kalaharituber pfeilii]